MAGGDDPPFNPTPTHTHTCGTRSFGVDVAVSCTIDVSGVLAQLDVSSNGPRFYDPFLAQASGALYPLPIQVLNKIDSYAPSETSGLPVRDAAQLPWRACPGAGGS